MIITAKEGRFKNHIFYIKGTIYDHLHNEFYAIGISLIEKRVYEVIIEIDDPKYTEVDDYNEALKNIFSIITEKQIEHYEKLKVLYKDYVKTKFINYVKYS